MKSKFISIITVLFFGFLGIHRFYLNKPKIGFILLSLFTSFFTLMLMSINNIAVILLLVLIGWWLYEIFLVLSGKLKVELVSEISSKSKELQRKISSPSVDHGSQKSSQLTGFEEISITMEKVNKKDQQKDDSKKLDIILFDAEDYGQPALSDYPRMEHSYCLGSQYWATHLHKSNYFAKYGILLDMVGGKNAVFTQELASLTFAPKVLKKVWNTAAELGYGNTFQFKKTNLIIDDHLYINNLAQGRVPTIDIIEYNEVTESHFYEHWHTHKDKLENIDKNTLKAVGQTVLQVVYNE